MGGISVRINLNTGGELTFSIYCTQITLETHSGEGARRGLEPVTDVREHQQLAAGLWGSCFLVPHTSHLSRLLDAWARGCLPEPVPGLWPTT